MNAPAIAGAMKTSESAVVAFGSQALIFRIFGRKRGVE